MTLRLQKYISKESIGYTKFNRNDEILFVNLLTVSFSM